MQYDRHLHLGGDAIKLAATALGTTLLATPVSANSH